MKKNNKIKKYKIKNEKSEKNYYEKYINVVTNRNQTYVCSGRLTNTQQLGLSRHLKINPRVYPQTTTGVNCTG